ncbi:hypothetical protein [Symmachiella dynata]|uniref:hypothetical protein n=1 Tax=Symmachiella dynata TaxID=2527995 RepID=UPI0030EE26A0
MFNVINGESMDSCRDLLRMRSTIFRSGILILLFTVIAYAGLNKSPIQYVGEITEVADLKTPEGFKISPTEVRDIIFARDGAKLFTDHCYADGNNYYVLNLFGLLKSRFSAKSGGRMINGQTGEIFNRTTELWEPDPRGQADTPLTMEHILALGRLLSELGQEYLVAFAQDRALTLHADSLEVDQKGDVWVSLTLAYNKQDAGEFLARYCPDEVVINKWNLPWSKPNRSWKEVSGIPDQFRVKDVFSFCTLSGHDPLGHDNPVTLNDGDKVSGKVWISNHFNDDFHVLKEKPDLDLFISAKTAYEKTTGNNLPEWIQERFGAYDSSGLATNPTSRTVDFKRVAVRSKPTKQPNPQNKQTTPSLATGH